MKFIAASLAILLGSISTATAEGTWSWTTYTSKFCATSSTLAQTAKGSEAHSGVCFPLPSPMASVNLTMDGTCSFAGFYSDTTCAQYIAGDRGSHWTPWCQTFPGGQFSSVKVIC